MSQFSLVHNTSYIIVPDFLIIIFDKINTNAIRILHTFLYDYINISSSYNNNYYYYPTVVLILLAMHSNSYCVKPPNFACKRAKNV